MELISRDIETLALAFPQVSFALSAIRRPSEVTDRVLNIPKVPEIASASSSVLITELPDIVYAFRLSSHQW